jgi:hypothetical protein
LVAFNQAVLYMISKELDFKQNNLSKIFG